jgi:Peptidase family M28
MAFWRNWLIGAAAVVVWLLCYYGQYRPAALGPDAAPTKFSAARADQTLARLLGPERPHPAGSAENAAIHDRLMAALRRLKVKTDTLSTMSCYSEIRANALTCARVTDLIGEVAPGEGPAIILMAHMDSVAAGPGAGDDGSGVATILESIRAWKAAGLASRHPVLALFTDGEENAMLGASAFLADPGWRARVGVVINLEARGSQGRSFLFQTSAGDAALIDLYARAVPHLATSSLYPEIYKILPNDTDLTPFLKAGFTGYNFAFLGKAADYHTPLDLRRNLDPQTLQQHGEAALGLLKALSQRDFAALKSGDAIYFDILGVWLPRLPKNWALPLALSAFAVIALAGWLTRKGAQTWRRRLIAAAAPPALLLGVVAAGFLLHTIAGLLSGEPDPSFAHPWALRLALSLGVWAVALAATRLGSGVTQAWLWISGFGVIAAALLPGLSPYFLFPALIAAILLLMTVRASTRWRQIAIGVAGLACAFTWLDLAASGEAIMGLRAHPLFTVSAGFALIALSPLLNQRFIRTSALASAGLALLFAVIAGFLPPFSATAPERLNLRYVEQAGEAEWLADPVARLPPALRRAGAFGREIESVPLFRRGYVARAGKARYPEPWATGHRQGEAVVLSLHGSPQADGMMLAARGKARFILEAVNGTVFRDLPPVSRFLCGTADCANATLTLKPTDPGSYDLVEVRRGLPLNGAALMMARPRDAVASGAGDQSLLISRIALPQR